MIKSKIRVRFAPSPTGYLHIGGARTALFNYLFAKHFQGHFVLRIEDTDTARSSNEMTEQILRSLKWLGIVWHGEPVIQSQNTGRHKSVCRELLDRGLSYPCFCTQEELAQRRNKSGSYMYDGKCRNLSKSEQKSRMEAGEPYVLRFKVEEGVTEFYDHVRGQVKVNNTEIDDFVILRSDGTPVYQIAVVVDDHDMGITHVIRGDDHLSNTPKQILIYKAMGWDIPEFAHIPMILGPDKKRLSKRHGAASVEEYRDMGVLAPALVNYLALLGWSPGDNREIMSLDEMTEAFSIDKVSKNPAVFDKAKLLWFNGKYIRNTDSEELYRTIKPYLDKKGYALAEDKDYVIKVVNLVKERANTYIEIVDLSEYFFADPEDYEEKAVKKHWLKPSVYQRIEKVYNSITAIKVWNEEAVEQLIRGLAEEEGVGAGKYIHPVRLALTGRGQSPGLFEVMVLLGKDVVERRLGTAMEILREQNIE